MRILYGVCGEGMGHATRADVVARHLSSRGHDVRLASSGGALRYLSQRWPGQVIEVPATSLATRDNRILPIQTLADNLASLLAGTVTRLPGIAAALSWRPNAVVTDFESWSARCAHLLGARLVSVGNNHFVSRCAHPLIRCTASDQDALTVTRPVTDMMIPWAGSYLITAIAAAPIIAQNTSLHAPILRESVLRLRGRETKDNVLVYLNTKADFHAPIRAMQAVDAKFRVYGVKDVERETPVGRNVTVCPFSEELFLEDLATCRAVIGTAGFGLLSEAAYLRKPVLAFPIEGQYEQILNAEYARMLGYGDRAARLDSDVIEDFLSRLPDMQRALSLYRHEGNRETLKSVEGALV